MSNTHQELKKIGAENIECSFDTKTFIGKLTFEIKGVSFQSQFDIDNAGLYFVLLNCNISELKKLSEK